MTGQARPGRPFRDKRNDRSLAGVTAVRWAAMAAPLL